MFHLSGRHELGLVNDEIYKENKEKYLKINGLIDDYKKRNLVVDEKVMSILKKNGNEINISGTHSVGKLMRRPEVSINHIIEIFNDEIDKDIASIVEMEIKYEGYIRRDIERIRKMERMENSEIPEDFEYNSLDGVKIEARKKLEEVRPRTIGQAMRISGVDPSVISVLVVRIEAIVRRKGKVPRGT